MNAFIVNSFILDNAGGNPAGVVLLNREFLTDFEMQSIASQLALSETAFVVYGKGDFDFEIRFFTPTDEVPLCGHATLASVYMLYRLESTLKNDLLIATQAGPIHLTLSTDDLGVRIFMKQPGPKMKKVPNTLISEIQACFSAEIDYTQYPPEIWNTGLDDLIVGLSSAETLNKITVDMDKLKALSQKLNLVGAHVFAMEKGKIYARNFAPLYGINEESATGTSNGALISYLHHHFFYLQDVYSAEIIQGVSMGAPSSIHASIEKTQTDYSVWVGGHCSWVKTITV